MNRNKGYIRIVLERQDCMTIDDALRIFAHELTEDCRRERKDKDLPDEVRSQAERLETIAAKLAQFDGLDCCYEAWISAGRRGAKHKAFNLSSADWRTAAVALGFLADRLRIAGDRINARQMTGLAEKTRKTADWQEGFFACIRKLQQVRSVMASENPEPTD